MASIPTPPNEDYGKHAASRKGHGVSKSSKSSSAHRASKRASTHGNHPPSPTHDSHAHYLVADGRNKRVWKACERCRMKKTKCDGEFPCKRCKDDGLVCTAGTRKKTEYKQLPKGYAEVLENTQFALVATVHKLYAMVRSAQPWELGEPELNDRGQPVIHNIASKLGCIRPNSDADLPAHSVFPEDEAGLRELARQLAEQESHDGAAGGPAAAARPHAATTGSSSGRTDRASSEELDHSDLEQDYRRAAFGGGGHGSGGGHGGHHGAEAVSMSPQSMPYGDFGAAAAAAAATAAATTAAPLDASMFATSAWRPPAMSSAALEFTQRYLQTAAYTDIDMLNQGLLESNFGTIKPHVLSCPNPEVMMGVGDPMIFSGCYDPETLRM